jgi:hypothetical protein
VGSVQSVHRQYSTVLFLVVLLLIVPVLVPVTVSSTVLCITGTNHFTNQQQPECYKIPTEHVVVTVTSPRRARDPLLLCRQLLFKDRVAGPLLPTTSATTTLPQLNPLSWKRRILVLSLQLLRISRGSDLSVLSSMLLLSSRLSVFSLQDSVRALLLQGR